MPTKVFGQRMHHDAGASTSEQRDTPGGGESPTPAARTPVIG